jgi:LIVCS family branched-chain amino acid:cation transporter
MGNYAALSIDITVMLACFRTFVALNSKYAKYLQSRFGLDDSKFKFVLAGTTIMSFFISLFDFTGISRFIAPVLEVSYPSIIALTVISIFSQKQYLLKKISFYGILAAVLLGKI